MSFFRPGLGLLWFLLAAFLPFQTRLSGGTLLDLGRYGSEYTTLWLYGTDLLVLFLLGAAVWVNRGRLIIQWRFLFPIKKLWRRPAFWLALFLLWSAIGVLWSSSLQLGAYKWLKLVEGAALFGLAARAGRHRLWPYILWGLVAGGLLQALLAGGQFTLQHDLGLKILGESPLAAEKAGVAKIDLPDGGKLIRAYGTTPHPNVLGAYLAAAIAAAAGLLVSGRRVYRRAGRRWLLGAALPILVFGLGFSFSRLAALALIEVMAGLVFLAFGFRTGRRPVAAGILLGVLLAGFLFGVLFSEAVRARAVFPADDQTRVLRSQYLTIAGAVIVQRPFRGAGLGQFITHVPDQLAVLLPNGPLPPWMIQPVHNVYFLIAGETGLIGLLLFLAFLFTLVRKVIAYREAFSVMLTLLLVGFLAIAFFDHFFWTLQQGQLLWWLTLGLLAGLNRRPAAGSRSRSTAPV